MRPITLLGRLAGPFAVALVSLSAAACSASADTVPAEPRAEVTSAISSAPADAASTKVRFRLFAAEHARCIFAKDPWCVAPDTTTKADGTPVDPLTWSSKDEDELRSSWRYPTFQLVGDRRELLERSRGAGDSWHRGFSAWLYSPSNGGAVLHDQQFEIKDPRTVNVPLLQIETYTYPTIGTHALQCSGTADLRFFVARYVADHPDATDLGIDATLRTTYTPGAGYDEASSCSVTYRINGVSFAPSDHPGSSS